MTSKYDHDRTRSWYDRPDSDGTVNSFSIGLALAGRDHGRALVPVLPAAVGRAALVLAERRPVLEARLELAQPVGDARERPLRALLLEGGDPVPAREEDVPDHVADVAVEVVVRPASSLDTTKPLPQKPPAMRPAPPPYIMSVFTLPK